MQGPQPRKLEMCCQGPTRQPALREARCPKDTFSPSVAPERESGVPPTMRWMRSGAVTSLLPGKLPQPQMTAEHAAAMMQALFSLLTALNMHQLHAVCCWGHRLLEATTQAKCAWMPLQSATCTLLPAWHSRREKAWATCSLLRRLPGC